MGANQNFRYQRKWARMVTGLSVWGILLLPVGALAGGTARIILLCMGVVMLAAAWFIRLRCLTCQGCGKSCAPLMIKKGTTAVCPYCGTPYRFDDEQRTGRSKRSGGRR